MNPPYLGDLHLNVLERACALFPNSEIASLHPLAWLQNPYGNRAQDEFGDIGISGIECIGDFCGIWDELSHNYGSLGICHKGEGTLRPTRDFRFDFCKSIRTSEFIDRDLVSHVVSLVSDSGFRSVESMVRSGNLKQASLADPSKWFLRMGKFIRTGPNRTRKYPTMFRNLTPEEALARKLFHNGRNGSGLFPEDAKQHQSNVSNYELFEWLEFDSEEEASNFVKSLYICAYRFLYVMSNCSYKRNMSWMPYLDDYSHEWTDGDLMRLLGISEDTMDRMRRYVEEKE